jgi:RNAse (barnase) inhibitor barstar
VNSELTVKWDRITKRNNVYLVIDKQMSMQRDLQKERMALWEKIMGSIN